jgi:hypothetical protein
MFLAALQSVFGSLPPDSHPPRTPNPSACRRRSAFGLIRIRPSIRIRCPFFSALAQQGILGYDENYLCILRISPDIQ